MRSTHILNIPVRVFCHLACKNGCPPDFKLFNDRGFRAPNMQSILDMLEGKANAKPWNNVHNASMHMMIKWDEEELRTHICPDMEPEIFAKLTPKEVGTHLEAWFQSLDTPDLESKKELEGILIPNLSWAAPLEGFQDLSTSSKNNQQCGKLWLDPIFL